jgi:hypothetical protein
VPVLLKYGTVSAEAPPDKETAVDIVRAHFRMREDDGPSVTTVGYDENGTYLWRVWPTSGAGWVYVELVAERYIVNVWCVETENTEPADQEWDGTYRTKSGKVLTDEEIGRLADEAEQGYDVSSMRDNLPRRQTRVRYNTVDLLYHSDPVKVVEYNIARVSRGGE